MPSARLIELPHDITCIDTELFRPGMAACYLVRAGRQAALIETGCTHSAHGILSVLAEKGIRLEDVACVIPTHVHLDHAGGAGSLIQQLPNARLVIHPRGARHMIDPSKLWAGSVAVYGEKTLLKEYGRPVPVPEERVLVAEDNFELALDGRRLLFIDTPGHARHHFSVWDETSRGFFTGDTFGVSYRQTDSRRGAFLMPTTTPVQFDPEAWNRSLDRYLEFSPERMYLTHYSVVDEVARLACDLRSDIDAYAAIARGNANGEDRHARIKADLVDFTLERLRQHDCPLQEADQRTLIEMDMELNAQGLGVWLGSTASAA